MRRREEENGGQELAELAALADGSLAPERRAALEARAAAPPELADRPPGRPAARARGWRRPRRCERASMRNGVTVVCRGPAGSLRSGPRRPRSPSPSASGW